MSPNNQKYLIINADDFGLTKGVNKSIIDLANKGIISSTSVMSNTDYVDDITNLKNKIGIGVHLNLTVGKPISSPKNLPTLTESEGSFTPFPMLLNRIRSKKISPNEVEREFKAQVEKIINLEIMPDHINTHQSLLKYPFFFKIIKKIAKYYRINSLRTYHLRKISIKMLINPMRFLKINYLLFQKYTLQREGFYLCNKFDSLLSENLSLSEALSHLYQILLKLPNGILELIVHPGIIDHDKHLLGNYVGERVIEYQCLIYGLTQELVEKNKINLITFNDLQKI